MQAHIVVSAQSTRFAGSEAEARQLRMAMVEKTGIKKSQITIEGIEIPTNKPDLLAFLNSRETAHEKV